MGRREGGRGGVGEKRKERGGSTFTEPESVTGLRALRKISS